jgi:hypothetical protein
LERLRAAQLRHLHIEEHQVDVASVVAVHLDGLLAGASEQRPHALLLQGQL